MLHPSTQVTTPEMRMYRENAAVTGEVEFTVFLGGGLVRAV